MINLPPSSHAHDRPQSPIEQLPPEIIVLIYQNTRAAHVTIRARQYASLIFSLVCRAFRHAQLLAPAPAEMVVTGADELAHATAGLTAGRWRGVTVRALEMEVTEDELQAGVELLELVQGGLVELELGVMPRGGGARGGRGSHSSREISTPVQGLISALARLIKLERVVLRGAKGMTVMRVHDLERCIHHWPRLDHLEYDQLGLHVPFAHLPPPPPLDRLRLPTGLRTLSIQSVLNDEATQLLARLVADSAATLEHVIIANAAIEPPEDLAAVLQPVATSLATLEYHLIQRTPFALAAAVAALPTLKHLIMPVDILRTKVVLAALAAKAADPAHAPLACLTLLPEEYHLVNRKAPKVMPAKRIRLLELAQAVEADKVRIGKATVEGADAFVAELERRGVGLEVVDEEELVEGGLRERWVWG